MKIWFSFLCFLLAGVAFSQEYYVAQTGDDANDGSIQRPFRTLEKARDVLRLRAEKTPAVVHVRAGVYELEKTFVLEEQDSNVTYRGFEGERPLLTGGKVVTGWTVWRGNVCKTNVKSQGLDGVGFRVLVCDGVRQILARYPNFDAANPYAGGWAYADGKLVPMYTTIPNLDKQTFQYREQDHRDWKKPKELWIRVFPQYNWWNNLCRVASIDPETRTVKLVDAASYQIHPGDRYHFENALEELDAPGEWYLDRETGDLYFWPPDSCGAEQLNAKTVTVAVNPTLVQIQDARNVCFVNFTLENAVRTAVGMKNTKNCVVEACILRNIGCYHSTAVWIDGGTQNGVRNCDLSYIGSTAIGLNGGDTKTLTEAGNFAEGCYIHHTGLDYKQGVGVSMTGVGNRVMGCEIHDCPRFGIGFGGQKQIIEYNEIHHVNLETSDTGAIYTGGRNWISSRGTQVRYNYFHDVIGFGWVDGEWKSPHYCWGIYLDDNAGGVDVYGNVVTGCIRGGIHFHSARDNHVWNNLFLDGGFQQFEANGWTVESSTWKNHFKTMVPGYESVAGEPAWKGMRHMELHPKDAPLPDGTVMAGNKVWNNIFCWNSEDSKAYTVRNFNPEYNEIDRNLLWNHGKPVTVSASYTGNAKVVGKVTLPGGGFEEYDVGQKPAIWGWQCYPTSKTKVEVVDTSAAEGKKSLCIHADYAAEKERDNTPAVLLPQLPLLPGKTYRLTLKAKTSRENGKIQFGFHYYKPGEYWGSMTGGKPGTDWKEMTLTFRVPAEGENGYREGMRNGLNLTLGNPNHDDTTVWYDAMNVEELESLDSWATWQGVGLDRHSVIADPMFVDEANGDYRLKPESPAWKLGFQPIPFDKIGLRREKLKE
ncbi:MAG: right-handed parallel beta-helix repeat-containing protein [Planctomycetia bacterium]|nr:right-handed parallel beta-helix repeat-containing protein [Planctomycetia bacterium]